MTEEGDGFRSGYFHDLEQLEAGNFWFESRNDLIAHLAARHCKLGGEFLEIGCGTGFVLGRLCKTRHFSRLVGSEMFEEGVSRAARRLPGIEILRLDARDLPFRQQFDAVGAFDVLEHVSDADRVLRAVHGALRPGGTFMVTVPQHPSLWSAADDYACHVRRYRRKEMESELIAAGFTIVMSSSFVFTLLPAMTLSRLLQRLRPVHTFEAKREFELPSLVNRTFLALLRIEVALIRLGFRFPVGGSRVVVARKP